MRVLKILVVIALAASLAAYLWSVAAPPRAGHLDATAADRIRSSCRFQSLCVVHLADLFAGDWDTFYEFGSDVPQSDIDHALRTDRLQRRPGQRFVVLTRHGRIVAAESEPTGPETPFDNEVEFGDEHNREGRMISLPRETALQVTSFPTTDAAGQPATFYVLRTAAPDTTP